MIYFVAGILVWQLVTFVFFLVTNQNEEKAMICGSFVPFFIAIGFCWVVRKILFFFEDYNIRSVMLCPDGKWRYCKSKYSHYLEQTEEYQFPRHTKEIDEKFPRALWNINKHANRSCCGNTGNFRYAPKTVWGNLIPIDKEIIKQAKKLYKRG